MQHSNFLKAGILAVILATVVMICWEIHLRNIGAPISYDDNEPLFSDKRAMVYEPNDKATVFIGSSKIKYDLDIPTWEKLTGNHAIQLANVGSNPRIVLADLAKDTAFHGKLVIDVTETVFFARRSANDELTRKKVDYYWHHSPTQSFSFQVDHFLQSKFVFLNQDFFSASAILDNSHLLPPRKGVFPRPPFPMEFNAVDFNRQSAMTPHFVADTALQNTVKGIWTLGRKRGRPLIQPGHELDSVLNIVKSQVDKIKARGGDVIFVRLPSSGEIKIAEPKIIPRDQYWNRLLEVTGCPGMHYLDYKDIDHYECPEWSHLSREQAVDFTNHFVRILGEKGWNYPVRPGT